MELEPVVYSILVDLLNEESDAEARAARRAERNLV